MLKVSPKTLCIGVARASRGIIRRVALALVCIAAMAALIPYAKAAKTAPATLTFFKNYFVTGSYVVGGVGLRGLGDATGFATGTISISAQAVPNGPGIPANADVVAAFLYWQTVEKGKSASAGMNGFFNSNAIVGQSLGNPNAPVSWSSGGCAGSSQGTTTLRTYRADVRPFLPIVNGAAQGAGNFQVRLADSGSNGGGAPLTLGATLVVIYRVMSKDVPLSAIAMYDGTFAPSNSSQPMSLNVAGFYEAGLPKPGDPAGAGNALAAQLTEIVGNGQPNKTESLFFNGNLLSSAAFPGSVLPSGTWDNPTYDVSKYVSPGALDTVSTMVTPAATNSGCVSWGAVIFSTTVQQSDNDGLLDVWKLNGGYKDVANGQTVLLPGATQQEQDLFVQIDYLASHDFIASNGKLGHSHLPKQAAIDMIGDALAHAPTPIHLHVDCGNCYAKANDPYIIPNGAGGNVIDENTVQCTDQPNSVPPVFCAFPGQVVSGWKGGIEAQKNQFFQHGRKDSYHYILMAHGLGLASNSWSISSGSLLSIVVADGSATVTTATANGLVTGARVTVSGAVSPAQVNGQDFTLNGTYTPITVTSPTTFTFPVPAANIPDGTYENQGLFVSSGPALTTSGWSDLGGADSLITLGLWRSDVPGDDQVGSALVQAGTIMHELGHTLGLQHGGTDGTNCKPNFQSVMNYLFQVRGIPGYDGTAHITYSGQELPGPGEFLNENALSENAGIGAAPFRTRWYAPFNFLDSVLNLAGSRNASLHCDGTPITDGAKMVRVEGPLTGLPSVPLDWNGDGTIELPNIAPQDVNFNGQLDAALAGSDDWNTIDLRQIGARRGVFGFSGDIWGEKDANGSLEDGSGGSLDDGAGGSLDDGAGGSLDDGAGGSLEDGAGGQQEGNFNGANSTVDPPQVGAPVQVKKTVVLTWTPPAFGQIRTYFIWRANTTNGPISPANLPINVGSVTGTPPLATFVDSFKLTNNTTYTYFVTSALGADSGPNNGNQSGPSNFVSITVHF